MAATNWTINGDSPTPVAEFALPYDLFLYNADPANAVYLDDTRGMLASSGAILPPLSTKIWKAGDPCFAICDAGLTARVNASKNSGDLQNPAAIATSILTQGLASQIASAINLQGVPSIDKLTLLLDETYDQDGAAHISAQIDVSQYASLVYSFYANDPATNAVPPDPGSNIGFFWYDSTGTVPIAQDFVVAYGDNNLFTGFEKTRGRFKVQAPTYKSVLQTYNRPGGTVRLLVYGSYRVNSRNELYSLSGYYQNTAATVSSLGLDRFVYVQSPGAMATGVSVAPWIPVNSGLCTALFTYNAATAGAGVDFLVQDQTNVPIAGVRGAISGVGGFTAQQSFYMPNRPVQCFLRNRTGANLLSPLQAVFTWEN
ncbi:MAG TPA: hypothetical protein VJ553_02000 [Candidatus Paceibacterota bacterium]|nr:hypothetical protein [Candidatus Paceibacterota bacterium]